MRAWGSWVRGGKLGRLEEVLEGGLGEAWREARGGADPRWEHGPREEECSRLVGSPLHEVSRPLWESLRRLVCRRLPQLGQGQRRA